MSTRHTTITRPSTLAATPMPARAPALSGTLVGVGVVTVEKLAPTLDEVEGPIQWHNNHTTDEVQCTIYTDTCTFTEDYFFSRYTAADISHLGM